MFGDRGSGFGVQVLAKQGGVGCTRSGFLDFCSGANLNLHATRCCMVRWLFLHEFGFQGVGSRARRPSFVEDGVWHDEASLDALAKPSPILGEGKLPHVKGQNRVP